MIEDVHYKYAEIEMKKDNYQVMIKQLEQTKIRLEIAMDTAFEKKSNYDNNKIKIKKENKKEIWVNNDLYKIQNFCAAFNQKIWDFKFKLISENFKLHAKKIYIFNKIKFEWRLKCQWINFIYLLNLFKFWLYVHRYIIIRFLMYFFMLWSVFYYQDKIVLSLNEYFDSLIPEPKPSLKFNASLRR